MKRMMIFFPVFAQVLWILKFIFTISRGKLVWVLFQATIFIITFQKMQKGLMYLNIFWCKGFAHLKLKFLAGYLTVIMNVSNISVIGPWSLLPVHPARLVNSNYIQWNQKLVWKSDIKIAVFDLEEKRRFVIEGLGTVLQVIQFVFLRDQKRDMTLALVRAYQDLCEVFPLLILVTGLIFPSNSDWSLRYLVFSYYLQFGLVSV